MLLIFLFYSSKYKGFGYIYDEKHFITTLKRDVIVVKSLPKELMAIKKKLKFVQTSILSSPEFYLKEVLPVLKRKGVLGLLISGGGCLKVLTNLGVLALFLLMFSLYTNCCALCHYMFYYSR